MLKRFFKRWENSMAAAAFAEAGEFETAKAILKEDILLPERIKRLQHEVALTIDELTSMAITFAEAGEFEKAMEILKETEDKLAEIKWSHEKELKKIVFAPKTSSI